MVVQADGDRVVTSPIWYTRGAVVMGIAVPTEALVLDVFPNPMGGAVTLSYYLARPEAVRLTVLDALGRAVLVVATGCEQGAGPHSVAIETGQLVPRVYVVRTVIGELVSVRRLVVE